MTCLETHKLSRLKGEKNSLGYSKLLLIFFIEKWMIHSNIPPHLYFIDILSKQFLHDDHVANKAKSIKEAFMTESN